MIFQCELDLYERLAPELDIVFDVGCRADNPFYFYDCEVHQFDPVPQPKALGIFNQVAVGDRIGEVSFHPEYGSILRRTFKPGKFEGVKHYTITVPMITIDQYCAVKSIKKIDLLKIDAEGYDLNVIRGAKNMLPNIGHIQWEHWDDESTEAIKAILKDYDIEELGGRPMNYYAKRR